MSDIGYRKYGTRKEAILRATVKVAATSGLRGVTFRAVATEAAINNSLIAHHFGTRASLLDAALDWAVERSIGVAHLEDFGTSPEQFIELLMRLLREESELQAFQYAMILEAGRREELRSAIRALYDQYEAALADSLKAMGRSDVNTDEVRALFGAIDAIVLRLVSGSVTEAEARASLFKVFDFAQT